MRWGAGIEPGLSFHAAMMAEIGAAEKPETRCQRVEGRCEGECDGAARSCEGAAVPDRADAAVPCAREVRRDGDRDDEVECEEGPHHLYYDGKKGWMLRVTVDVGKSVVGKRLKFRLRTRELGEAEKARELVLATLKRLGLRVRLRMQVGRVRSGQ